MATTATLSSIVLIPSRLGHRSRRYSLSKPSSFSFTFSAFKPMSSLKVQASSSTAFVDSIPKSITEEKNVSTSKDLLACPICYDSFIRNGEPELSVDSAPQSSLQCNTCKKAYFSNEIHLDLTVASGAKEYGESMPASTELFRLPLVSYLYERGWRQSFSLWGGFPGPEKEFELTKGYLKPVLGGNIIDASCGSGLFSRLFAKSGLFSHVIALDFSENMLRQCYEFIKQDASFPKENLMLVRAVISPGFRLLRVLLMLFTLVLLCIVGLHHQQLWLK